MTRWKPWLRKPMVETLNPEPSAVRSQQETSAEMKALSAPVTIQEAREQGATAGTIMQVPLAPAKGPITIVPEVVRATTEKQSDGSVITTPAQEPMVALVVKNLWDSPTIIKARRIIIGCIAAGALSGGGILATAISSGKNIWQLPWGQAGTALLTVAFGALIAAVTAGLTTGYFAIQKVSDNNPIRGTTPK